MKGVISLCFIIILCFVTVFPLRTEYSRHKLLKVTPTTKEHVNVLKFLKEKHNDNKKINFWSDTFGINTPSLLQASSNYFESVLGELSKAGLSPQVVIEDIQKLINDQSKRCNLKSAKRTGKFALDVYHNNHEITSFLRDLSWEHEDAEYSVGGSSYEGRDISIFHIGSGSRYAIGIECGAHAREWISPAICINFINNLLTNPEVEELRNEFDWYIIPVTNPDGYEYTWTEDRLWRKNRRNGSECDGVDLNRNYDSNFGGEGSSGNECDCTYKGTEPFSEPETQTVRDLVNRISNRLFAFWAVHSFGQILASPYCYSNSLTDDHKEMQRVINISVAAVIATHNQTYRGGHCANDIYINSGTTIDWVYDTHGLVYSTLIEARDLGDYGFLLPEEQIIPTYEENWNGIRAAIEAMKDNHNKII